MAFFSKLKERLFKSSSKIDAGLEAIVEDGGVTDEIADEANAASPDPEPAQAEEFDQAASDAEFEALMAEMAEVTPEEAAAAEAAEPWVEPDDPIDASLDAQLDELEKDIERLAEQEIAPEPESDKSEAVAKPGLVGRLLGRRDSETIVRRTLDDEMLESIEELLITADMGAETSMRVAANMAEGRFGRKFSIAELKDLMAAEITRIMEPVAKPMPIYPKRPQVVLVVGVNGSGKTTTIGKLASQFRAAGKSVIIAAGDTFRAAAVEQLQIWGERAGVPVMTAPEGSDPASLAFDAMTRAEAEGADLLMIDTAGRLQNRADLMEELAKIVRVIRKKDPDAPHNTLLVLDATTGQNALRQVEIFQKF